MRMRDRFHQRVRGWNGTRGLRAILLLALLAAGVTATTGCPRGGERVNEHQRTLERERD